MPFLYDERDKTYRESFKASLMMALFLLRTCSKHFQFMYATSSNSKFDHYRRNEVRLQLTKQLVMLYLIPNVLPVMQQI
jgi:hypothetical protein